MNHAENTDTVVRRAFSGAEVKAQSLAKVVQQLLQDYERRGGYISGDHVLRAIEKRGLDIEDDALVRAELRKRGYLPIEARDEGLH